MCSKIAFSILSLVALILGPASKAQMIPDPGTPDTVALSDVITSVGSGQAVVPVSFYNDEELGGLEVTLTWDSPNVHIDSFSFVGGRVAALSTIGWSATSSTVSIYAVAWTDLIPVGSGLLGNLYVGWPTSIDSEIVTFDTTTIIQDQIEHRTTFSTGAAEMFIPQFLPATLELESSGCCIGDRGNVNGSADDNIDISDLVALVEYMFLGGSEPACPEEANIDGQDEIDISDLVALVAYMFQGGDPPAPCY
jgi:hypothetical protein